jgi:MtN3 and saliva related transmembrane protein
MNPQLVELVGIAGATLTTICWLPQAAQIIRTRETRAISLIGYAAFVVGIVCWLIYGVAILNWPLIGANAVTLVLALTILGLKLRHG